MTKHFLSRLADFGHQRGGEWGWIKLLKKENLRRKSFSDKVGWSSKTLKKIISSDVKTDVKQKIKEMVAASYNFSQK